MTPPKDKKVSVSKRVRAYARIRRACTRVFGELMWGVFYARELVAALVYKQYERGSYRDVEEALKEPWTRARLGVTQRISKSTLQRASARVTRAQREALLQATLVKGNEGSLLVDATGETTGQYGRWRDDKTTRARQYRKAHAGVGARSRQFLAFRVTRGARNDSLEFARLHRQATANARFEAVKGDGGYASRAHATRVRDAGQTPYLKPAKTVTAKTKGSRAWRDMVTSFWETPVQWLAAYHERSQVESVFSAFKRRFGAALRATRWRAQRVELELRAVAYNAYAAIQYAV